MDTDDSDATQPNLPTTAQPAVAPAEMTPSAGNGGRRRRAGIIAAVFLAAIAAVALVLFLTRSDSKPGGVAAGNSSSSSSATSSSSSSTAPNSTTGVADTTTPGATSGSGSGSGGSGSGGTVPPPTSPETTPTTQSTAVRVTKLSGTRPECSSGSAPDVSFTLPPTTPQVTLSWSTVFATSVDLSVDGPGIYQSNVGASGSMIISYGCPGPHTYTITAHGAGGTSASKTITISP